MSRNVSAKLTRIESGVVILHSVRVLRGLPSYPPFMTLSAVQLGLLANAVRTGLRISGCTGLHREVVSYNKKEANGALLSLFKSDN